MAEDTRLFGAGREIRRRLFSLWDEKYGPGG